MARDIHHNESASRFETTAEGEVAFVEYDLEPGRIVFTHTIVPASLSGRGIAGDLVAHALDHAREQRLGVVPQCSFVAAYIRRNPEYQDLLAVSE